MTPDDEKVAENYINTTLDDCVEHDEPCLKTAFLAGRESMRERVKALEKVAEAADSFVDATQERSKIRGHNYMLNPTGYIQLLEALVGYRVAALESTKGGGV